jgi:PBP1b-binding outer membrane lipoprotein LpoB
MNISRKTTTLRIAIMLLAIVFTAGCTGIATPESPAAAASATAASASAVSTTPDTQPPEAMSSTGRIMLSVNPKISLQYNERGETTNIEGLNEEGRQIVAEYNDYLGKA